MRALLTPAGPGDSDQCGEDKRKPAGEVCDARADNPCMRGGKCDGSGSRCPKVKKALTGTPCNSQGLFEEALDAKGRLALKGHISQATADAHGWSTCDRCYEGQCQRFQWEFWGQQYTKEMDPEPSKPEEVPAVEAPKQPAAEEPTKKEDPAKKDDPTKKEEPKKVGWGS